MNKNIENINDKGQLHGYVELYWDNILTYRANFKNNRPVVIFLRANYKNNNLVGYVELHGYKQTHFHIR